MLKEIDYWLKLSGSNPSSSNDYGSILTKAFGSDIKNVDAPLKRNLNKNFEILENDTQDD